MLCLFDNLYTKHGCWEKGKGVWSTQAMNFLEGLCCWILISLASIAWNARDRRQGETRSQLGVGFFFWSTLLICEKIGPYWAEIFFGLYP